MMGRGDRDGGPILVGSSSADDDRSIALIGGSSGRARGSFTSSSSTGKNKRPAAAMTGAIDLTEEDGEVIEILDATGT